MGLKNEKAHVGTNNNISNMCQLVKQHSNSDRSTSNQKNCNKIMCYAITRSQCKQDGNDDLKEEFPMTKTTKHDGDRKQIEVSGPLPYDSEAAWSAWVLSFHFD